MNTVRLIILSFFASVAVASAFSQGAIDGAVVVKIRGAYTSSLASPQLTLSLPDTDPADSEGEPVITTAGSGGATGVTEERAFTFPIGTTVRLHALATNVNEFSVTIAAPDGYYLMIDDVVRDAIILPGAKVNDAPVAGTVEEGIEIMLVRNRRSQIAASGGGTNALGDAGPLAWGSPKSSFGPPGIPQMDFNLGVARNGTPLPALNILINGPYWGPAGCMERYEHPDIERTVAPDGTIRIETPQVIVEFDPHWAGPVHHHAADFELRFQSSGDPPNTWFAKYQFAFTPHQLNPFAYRHVVVTKRVGSTAYQTSLTCAPDSTTVVNHWADVNIKGKWTVDDWHKVETPAKVQRHISVERTETGVYPFNYSDSIRITDSSGQAIALVRNIEYKKTDTTYFEDNTSYRAISYAAATITEGSASGAYVSKVLLDPKNRPVGHRAATGRTSVAEYAGTGPSLRPVKLYRTWLNTSPVYGATGDITAGDVETIEYLYANDWNGSPILPQAIRRKLGTVLVGESAISYDHQAVANGHRLVIATHHEFEAAGTTGNATTPRSTTDGTSLVTILKTYRADTVLTNRFLANRPYSIERPDGTKSSYLYETGTYTPGQNPTAFPNATGSDFRVTVLNGAKTAPIVVNSAASGSATLQVDPVGMIAYKSTKHVQIVRRGLVIRQETHVFTGGTAAAPLFTLIGWEDFSYTANGQLASRTGSDNAQYTATWVDGLLTEQKDETGLLTTYTYDSAGRLETTTEAKVGEYLAEQTTSFAYDAENRIVRVAKGSASPGAEQVVTERLYTDAGLLDQLTEAGIVSKFTYPNNARDTQIARGYDTPDVSTRLITRFADQRVQRISGSGVVEEYYTYNFDPQNRFRVTRQLGPSTARKRPTVTVYDLLGRVVEKRMNGFGPTGSTKPLVTYHRYNARGLLWKTYTQEEGDPQLRFSADNVMEYDELGQLKSAGLDLDENATLQANSIDRYAAYDSKFEKDANNIWWHRSARSIHHTNNSAETHTAISRVRVGQLPPGVLSYGTETDYHGNVSTAQLAFSSSSTGGYHKSISTQSDGTTLERTIAYGSTIKERWFPDNDPALAGDPTLAKAYYYDGLGRMTKALDAQTGGNPLVEYHHGTPHPWKINDPRGVLVATHTYDAVGRLTSSVTPVSEVNYKYTTRSEILETSGSGANPLRYSYTPLGELHKLVTYRNGLGGGTYDTTTWEHDDNTGWLSAKTDMAQGKVVYGYTLSEDYWEVVRTWARARTTNPTTTTYRHSPSTGDLLSTVYNGAATPHVHYTYTRAGNLETVTDAAGLRRFFYNNDQLQGEYLSPWYGSFTLTSVYQTATNRNTNTVAGRYAGFHLGVDSDLNPNNTNTDIDREMSLAIAYEDFGRIDTLTGSYKAKGVRPSSSIPSKYRYKSGADTWDQLTQGNYRLTRVFENNRPVLVSIVGHHQQGSTIAGYLYESDDIGNRKWVRQDGMAFEDFVDSAGDSIYYDYAYDGKGQLTGAMGSRGRGTGATVLPGRDFSYTYDEAGNRRSVTVSGETVTYRSGQSPNDPLGSNLLNQPRSRGTLRTRVSGTTSKNAQVKVATYDAVRESPTGRYWDLSVPGYQRNSQLSVTATEPGQSDLTASVRVVTRPQHEVLQYDGDGNLLRDSQWIYEWDAENRLVRMYKNPDVSWSVPNRELLFTYDYLGRRIRKVARENNATTYDRKFLYDGWNLIAEIDGTTGKIVRSYIWGLDVASSLAATGGVGALLLETVHTDQTLTSYHVAYDGNGNVTALAKRNPNQPDDGKVAAAYEYGPFGEVVRAQTIDPMVADQPFRFSTKFTDVESGLIYYGHRYYDPSLGRFISRDPIGEAGGPNLYAFAGNNAVNNIDVLGHQTPPNEGSDEGIVRDWPPPGFGGLLSHRYDFPIWVIPGEPTYWEGIAEQKDRESYAQNATDHRDSIDDIYFDTAIAIGASRREEHLAGKNRGVSVRPITDQQRYDQLLREWERAVGSGVPGAAERARRKLVTFGSNAGIRPIGVPSDTAFRGPGSPSGSVYRPLTHSEIARGSPGTATGANLPAIGIGQQWLRGTGRDAGRIPGQIAARLNGRKFNSFDEFREAFWKEVAKDPFLRQQFGPVSQREMEAGRAPFAPGSGRVGGRAKYEIDHMIEIQNGGGVYDLNNLIIRTPVNHIGK